MTQYKFKVLGGAHYPKPDECFVNGKSVNQVKKGEIFVTFSDLRKQYPNRFELVNESEVPGTTPVLKSTASAPAPASDQVVPVKVDNDPFPAATAAGLVVKEKKIKGKGVRFFIYDKDILDTPLNSKSLAEEEVEGFVADHIAKQ